ncbi:MAG: hypothetical protein PHE55_08725 [Methylococcaceae bacterium]|nr:hypothetical protein [Methylococcaceae bacterium]
MPLALDGTRYFLSKKIHCECCSTQQHANGQVTYFHFVPSRINDSSIIEAVKKTDARNWLCMEPS